MLLFVARWIEFGIFLYFVLLNSFYLILYFLSIPVLYRRFQEIKSEDLNQLLSSDSAPPIAIIMPLYNEKKMILSSVRAALDVNYRHIDIIVVNDGSTDDTLEILRQNYQLIEVPHAFARTLQTEPVKGYYKSLTHSNLLVIDKVNGGREDSLNAGLNACLAPFCLLIDGDSLVEPDICQRMMRPFLSQPDTIAIGGTLRLSNGCVIREGKVAEVHLPHSFWALMQVIDYMRTFLFGRIGWSRLGGQYLISGGFGLYKKEALLEAGGFHKVLAGDLDLTLRLHATKKEKKEPYFIDYITDALVWTDVPSTYAALRKQRERWQRSIVDVCWSLKYLLFNPKYGRVGFIHMPYLVFGELGGAFVEGFGYCYIIFAAIAGILNTDFIVFFILLAWGFALALTLFSLLMDMLSFRKTRSFKDTLKILGISLIENIGYRQLNVLWRIEGCVRFFTKKRFAREKVER